MSTKQYEHESPQQFLYRMIGLKQKVMFASKQDKMDIKYEPWTEQNIFLLTVHQGLLPKYTDVRNKLKPLLSDCSVTDEALIRQVNKVSGDESKRQRQLGQWSRQKITHAHSAQFSPDKGTENLLECRAKSKNSVIEEMNAKIDALTKVIEALMASKTKEQTFQCGQPNQIKPKLTQQIYGCPKCTEKGARSCSYCFVCGEGGRRAAQCYKERQAWGSIQSPTDANAININGQQNARNPSNVKSQSGHEPFTLETGTGETVAQLVGSKCRIKCYIHS